MNEHRSGARIHSENRTGAILMLAVGQTIVWAGLFYIFPAMILHWGDLYGWGNAQLTGAITLALILSAVCSPMVGRLIDTGRGPAVMVGGAVAGSLILFVLSQTDSLLYFYLLWALMGIALAACLYEPCFMLVTRAYGARAKKSIVTITLIAGFASSISFPVSHFIASTYGVGAVLTTFGLAVLVIGAPLLYAGASILEHHAQIATRPQGYQQRYLLRDNPLVIQLGLCFALLAIVHGATLQHLLPVLNDRALSAGDAVLIASLIGPMQVVGRLIVTAFQRWLPHTLIASACFIFIGLSMVLLFFTDGGLQVAVLFAVVFGASYGVVSIIRPVIARDIVGDQGFGAKAGYLAFFYLIGSAVSPYLGSLVWMVGGYDLMIPVLACLSLAGLVAMRHVFRRHRLQKR